MKWLLERLSTLALVISGLFLFAMMIHVAADSPHAADGPHAIDDTPNPTDALETI